jgi:hypothetical protein
VFSCFISFVIFLSDIAEFSMKSLYPLCFWTLQRASFWCLEHLLDYKLVRLLEDSIFGCVWNVCLLYRHVWSGYLITSSKIWCVFCIYACWICYMWRRSDVTHSLLTVLFYGGNFIDYFFIDIFFMRIVGFVWLYRSSSSSRRPSFCNPQCLHLLYPLPLLRINSLLAWSLTSPLRSPSLPSLDCLCHSHTQARNVSSTLILTPSHSVPL